MASFEKSKSGKWSVRFRTVIDGITVQKRISGFNTKRDADIAYINYLAEHPAQEKALPNDLTVEELFANYKAYIERRNKQTTVMTVCGTLERYALSFFAGRKVRKLKPIDIVKWQNSLLSQNFSQTYLIKIFAFFNTMLNFGKKYYDLPNVAEKVGNFKRTQKAAEMQVWTEKEFLQFIAVVDKPVYRVLFSFLYLTGCRKGEAMALTWADINFDKGFVHIQRTCDYHISGLPYKIFDTPKNLSSIRDIYLPPNLLSLLRNFRQETHATPKDFIFGGSAPLPAETIRREFHRYCDIARVKRIRIHDLRHSHASLLISKGQDIRTVAHRLGHKDIVQTLNTYSHFMPDKQQEILNTINIDLGTN